MDQSDENETNPTSLNLAQLDLSLQLKQVECDEESPVLMESEDPAETGFLFSTEQTWVTPTSDCVLKTLETEGPDVFINIFEFHLEEDQTVHQIFLKSKSRYMTATLYCNDQSMLDWCVEYEDLKAQWNMTPRQNAMYVNMVGAAEIGTEEAIHILPLRDGTHSEESFRVLSKLYKNWRIEYEFSEQVPETILHVGLIVKTPK